MAFHLGIIPAGGPPLLRQQKLRMLFMHSRYFVPRSFWHAISSLASSALDLCHTVTLRTQLLHVQPMLLLCSHQSSCIDWQ